MAREGAHRGLHRRRRRSLRSWQPGIRSGIKLSLMPNGGWLSTAALESMWDTSGAANGGEPLAVDGLLYTNNATMFIATSSGPYKGRAILNGGLIGADLGILVPGEKKSSEPGLQLNYDARHDGVLQLQETGTVELVRGFRVR